MPASSTYVAVLREEAARCERISHGLTDRRLIADLLAWADEYRRNAESLDAMLRQFTVDTDQRAA